MHFRCLQIVHTRVDSNRSPLGSKFTFAGAISKESDVRASEKEMLTQIINKPFKGPAILQLIIKNTAGATG